MSTDTFSMAGLNHPEYNTIIHDANGVYCTRKTVKTLLNEACIERACTYEGRIEAIRAVTSYMKKTPLIICLVEKIYAFPIVGPNNYDCVWLFPENIVGVEEEGNGRLTVQFIDGTSISVNCSLRTFHTQKKRAVDSMHQFSSKLFRRLKTRSLFI
nr:competence protein ComK [Bacillus sp. REN10]